jgi:hypothetical protein
MSSGRFALSRAKSCLRSFLACFGWIPALDPALKNLLDAFVPEALNQRIQRIARLYGMSTLF